MLLLDGVSVVFVVAVKASWWSIMSFMSSPACYHREQEGRWYLMPRKSTSSHHKLIRSNSNYRTTTTNPPLIHPSPHPSTHPQQTHHHPTNPKNAQRRIKTQRPPLPSTPPWRLQMGQHTRPSLCNTLPQVCNPQHASPDIPDLPHV
jgi:hypothetical protein